MRKRLPVRTDMVLRVSLLDSGRVEVWSRDALAREEFVALLRTMADKFESDDVKRVE